MTYNLQVAIKEIADTSHRSIQDILYYFIYAGLNSVAIPNLVGQSFVKKGRRKEHRLYMRLPARTVEVLDDLAWLHGLAPHLSDNNGGGYVIGLCANWFIKRAPVDNWVSFFTSGQDLQERVEDII